MIPGPILLRPDNFTSAARTPWGGTKLVNSYKRFLLDGRDPEEPVGESWELSLGPELPSSDPEGRLLSERVDAQREGFLGVDAPLGGALLVKWLDTRRDLSLQIHPPDDRPELAAGEAGKTEAWYVVEREPGASLYLGWKPGTDRRSVERALAGGDPAVLLRRLPVEPGDFVLVEPGMPHAIGAGITLIEPQHVAPNQRAVTYRYWDWNRRYDERGLPDASGHPRPLQAARALAVTDWNAEPCPLHHAGAPDRSALASRTPLCGPAAAPISSRHLWVERLAGNGTLALPDWKRLRALTVIDGSVQVAGVEVTAGRSAALPAALGPEEMTLRQAHALICAAPAT